MRLETKTVHIIHAVLGSRNTLKSPWLRYLRNPVPLGVNASHFHLRNCHWLSLRNRFIGATYHTHMLHVWNIYLHVVHFWGKCRYIYIYLYTIHGAYGIYKA